MMSASPGDASNTLGDTTLADLPAWQIMTARFEVPIYVTTDKPRTFWGRLSRRSIENVTFTRISGADHIVERSRDLISDRIGPRYKLNLQLAGTGLLMQDGREVVLNRGDFALLDTHRPYSTAFGDEFEIMVIEFPQQLLDLPKDSAAQFTAVRMSGTEGHGRLVGPFLTNLADNLDLLSGNTGPQFAQNALDMVGTMFASELGRRGVLDVATPRVRMLDEVRSYIEANLAAPDLGPGSIAAAHFISTRHLHSLFHDQPQSVSAYIRSRKLSRCRYDLRNALYTNCTVSEIAARWGFHDLAHFSKLFKATYGVSPGAYRLRLDG